MNSINDKQGFWWRHDGIHKHGLGVCVGLPRPFITVEYEYSHERPPPFGDHFFLHRGWSPTGGSTVSQINVSAYTDRKEKKVMSDHSKMDNKPWNDIKKKNAENTNNQDQVVIN